MNDLTIKQPAFGDNISKAQQLRQNATQLAGLAASFEDLLKGIGGNSGTATPDIGQSLIAGIRETDPYREQRNQEEPRDDAAPRTDARDSGARDENTTEAPKAENRDDGGRDNRADDHRDGDADHGDTGTRDRADNGEGHGDDGRSDDGNRQASDDGSGAPERGREDNGNSQGGAEAVNNSNGGEGNVVSQTANAVQQTVQGHVAQQVLSAVAARTTNGTTVQTNVAATETGKSNAVDGLATATANTNKGQSVNTARAAGNHGQSNTGNGQNAANQQQTAQASNAATQTTNAGNAEAARQQAAELSRQIGAGDQVRVNVNVTNDQGGLTSKPTATLVQTTTTGANTGETLRNGQQSTGNQNQNQASGQKTNAQAQANGQTANTQAAQQAASGADIAAQVAQQARVAGGSAHAANSGPVNGTGGLDGNSTTQNSNGTGQQAGQALQAQQSRATAPTQAQSQANQTQRAPLPNQSVVDQVSVKITKALQNGADRISIQLKPADLGRVDIKMELTQDGRVMAVVSAEKQDTLDLLRRDASELQKALADAGLKTDAGDLAFNLRGQEGEGGEGEEGGPVDVAEEDDAADDGTAVDDGVMLAHEGGILANGRIDVRA